MEKPALVIVDSVQTLDLPDQGGVPGSVGQIRESSAALTALAKVTGTPMFMVGHITKEGSLAGPKVLADLGYVVQPSTLKRWWQSPWPSLLAPFLATHVVTIVVTS